MCCLFWFVFIASRLEAILDWVEQEWACLLLKLWKAELQKRLRIYGKVNTGAAGVRIVLGPHDANTALLTSLLGQSGLRVASTSTRASPLLSMINLGQSRMLKEAKAIPSIPNPFWIHYPQETLDHKWILLYQSLSKSWRLWDPEEAMSPLAFSYHNPTWNSKHCYVVPCAVFWAVLEDLCNPW